MANFDRTDVDSDLAERLRQMEIVCLFKFQCFRRIGTGVKNTGNLEHTGQREFGLTKTQVHYCRGRARNFINEMRELDRARNRADLARYGSSGRPAQVRAIANGDGTWRIEELSTKGGSSRRSINTQLLKEAA